MTMQTNILSSFLKVAAVEVVRMSRGELLHAARAATHRLTPVYKRAPIRLS